MPDAAATQPAPIILVPGFWLGAWAWDEVAERLRDDGHQVTALTLPGMTSAGADRAAIRLQDHIDAIADAVRAAGRRAVLAVHSAAGLSGYAASDVVADRLAAMVYVDTAPGHPPFNPAFEGPEMPLNWTELEQEENLEGLSEEQKAIFRERAIPVPGGVVRDGYTFTSDARRQIPSLVIATSYSPQDYRDAAEKGYSWLAGLSELSDLHWTHLPTGHWPMWSRPADLADIIGRVAFDHPQA